MHLLVLFAIPKSIFSFKSIKTMLKSLQVYLQYGIAIERVVTRKGLPSVQ